MNHGDKPAALLDWIDDIADQFESAWQQGAPPRLVDFLGGEQGQRRSALLEELILVDWEQRCKIGERRSLDAYLEEFPELRRADGAVPEGLKRAANQMRLEHGEAAGSCPGAESLSAHSGDTTVAPGPQRLE